MKQTSGSLRSRLERTGLGSFILLGITTSIVSTAAHAQSRAYVANSAAHVVSVIDTATDAVLGTIPVGNNPSGVAVAADGRRAYVTNAASDSVSVIDTAANAVVGTISVGDAPSRIAVSPDGQKVYVLRGAGGAGVVEVIDTSLAAVVASITVGGNGGGIAFTPDGTRAYVASGLVSVIDTATSTIVASFLPEAAPVQDVSHTAVSVAMSPDGTRAYIARVTFNFTGGNFSAGGGVVTVDTATNTVIATTNTGSLPGGGIDITPDGSRLYVALVSTWVNVGTAQGFLPAKVVAAIDTTTNTVVGWIVVANTPSGVAVTPDGAETYVTIPTGSTVAVIATATSTISTTLPVATSPGGIDTFDLPEPTITVYCAGDGSGAACPCANASAPGAGEGCLNSLGLGGKLRTSGVARIGSDTLVLEGWQMPDSTSLFFQGTLQVGGGAGAVFADGLRCAGGQVIRLGTKLNAGGASQYPGAGDPSISFKGLVTVPGSVRTYQVWYRNPDAFCTPETTNYTNGLEVRWEF